MALTLTEKFRMSAGGRSFRMYEVTADGSTVSIDATDLDMTLIEFASITPPAGLIGTASITASDLATVTGSTLTSIGVTGASFGDSVVVGTDSDGLGLLIVGYVSKADEVAIRVNNSTAGTVTPPTGYKATVIKNIGLVTYTGAGIVFGPTLTSGDKFNLQVIGW